MSTFRGLIVWMRLSLGLVLWSGAVSSAQTDDYGDLPDPVYPTKLASDGARHAATAYLFLGAVPADPEGDAFPTTTGLGDDQNGSDDEDGFDPSSVLLAPGTTVNLPVKVNNWMSIGSARLYAFADWNHDGDFSDPDEAASLVVPSPNMGITLSIPMTIPANAVTKSSTALRLRLSTDQNLGPTGPASNGEVEDYFVPVKSDYDFGDLPAPYPTLIADNGARHVPTSYLYMGLNGPDSETDGQPDAFGLGDDTASIDDEDGFNPVSVHPVPDNPVDFPVIVTTPAVSGATLYGFTDWNNDGDFDDAGEQSSLAVPFNGSGHLVNLPWKVPATAVTGVPLAVRLRLTSNQNVGPSGLCTDGEVEDYHVVIASGALDFGDLPDGVAGTAPGSISKLSTMTQGDYRTRLADKGPQHGIRPDLALADGGDVPDAEADGQPTAKADGDDLNGDDEATSNLSVTNQVVSNITPLSVDATITFAANIAPAWNRTGSMAYATGFLDFNNDGDFDDPGERQTSVVPSSPSGQPLLFSFTHTWHVVRPITSFNLALPLRIRLSTEPDLGPDGSAPDGEVEDHLCNVQIDLGDFWAATPLDFGDMTDIDIQLGGVHYPVKLGQNGACHVIVPGMFLGDKQPDAENDGQPTQHAYGDDIQGADDEDGFFPDHFHPVAGQPIDMAVKVTTPVTSGAILYGFIDWNYDGDFDEPGERSSVAVGAGLSGTIAALPWNVPSDAIKDTMLYTRLRLTSDQGLGPGGLAHDGEVEDFRVVVLSDGWDFGDLPDAVDGTAPGVVYNLSTVSQGDYRTRLADNGPRHKIRPDLLFQEGPAFIPIDAEADAIPGGDFLSGPDTEVPIYSAIIKQNADNFTPESMDIHLKILFTTVALNETGQPAYLTGFLDANNDGDFDDPGEKTTVVVPSAATPPVPDFQGIVQELYFYPDWHVLRPNGGGTIKAPFRFRLSTQPDLGPDGPAPDGEVQDGFIEFSLSWDPWWTDANAGFDAFMLKHGLFGAASLPGSDPDQDGRNNFAEYAFGGNPGLADAVLAFQPRVVDIGGKDYGLVAYLRLMGGANGPGGQYQTPSVLYRPEGSLDLSSWDQPLLDAPPPGDLPIAPPGYEWGAVRFTVPIPEQPLGMVRWKVGPP